MISLRTFCCAFVDPRRATSLTAKRHAAVKRLTDRVAAPTAGLPLVAHMGLGGLRRGSRDKAAPSSRRNPVRPERSATHRRRRAGLRPPCLATVVRYVA